MVDGWFDSITFEYVGTSDPTAPQRIKDFAKEIYSNMPVGFEFNAN